MHSFKHRNRFMEKKRPDLSGRRLINRSEIVLPEGTACLIQIQHTHLFQRMSAYQDAFFFVGFRSRNTALRNFKQFTGTTPVRLFSKTDN